MEEISPPWAPDHVTAIVGKSGEHIMIFHHEMEAPLTKTHQKTHSAHSRLGKDLPDFIQLLTFDEADHQRSNLGHFSHFHGLATLGHIGSVRLGSSIHGSARIISPLNPWSIRHDFPVH